MRKEFIRLLTSRDSWCISRQRAWGVPIPLFFNKTTDLPLINPELVNSTIETLRKYSTDAWWTLPVEKFISEEMANKFSFDLSDVEKGRDILDVWFDSGCSCLAVDSGEKINQANLYIEGVDQFRGWFLSSLLISTIMRNQSPYKQLLWHGFVVDETGKKMSKSVGNVVDPIDCIYGSQKHNIPAVGLDGLRLWAARSQNESLVKLGTGTLTECRQLLLRIRNSFSFMLGNIENAPEKIKFKSLVDRYILHRLSILDDEVRISYEQHNFRKAVHLIDRFFTADLSQFYFTVSKDRLYCEPVDSPLRKSALFTMKTLTNHLLHLLAPLIPFTSEEVSKIVNGAHYQPKGILASKFFTFSKKISKNENQPANSIVSFFMELRSKWLHHAAPTDSTDFIIDLMMPDTEISMIVNETGLTVEQLEDLAQDVLHVIKVNFHNVVKHGEHSESFQLPFHGIDNFFEVDVVILWNLVPPETKCPRCRRFQVEEKQELCKRCSNAVPK